MKEKHYKNLEELLENRIFYQFSQICQIPHCSYNEKELSDFILDWAKNLGLEAIQDEYSNLLIKKPGTKGYEGINPVILQAHIDMVCEKSPGVDHDFAVDPIDLQLDGDILSTGNKTTLGADNGIGVAMIMAILESDTIEHPPIEVLLTTAEEEDMSGALSVDLSWFSSNRLINLDNAVEDEIISGSCGGMGVEFKIPLEYIDCPQNYRAFKISIEGLNGGHSGEDIHRGRGNANKLLGRLLYEYRGKFPFLMGDIRGGNFRLAIPREAHGTILLEPKYVGLLKETTSSMVDSLLKEYGEADPDMKIQLEETTFESKVIKESVANRILDAIILSPNGIEEMNGNLNVVVSSCNLGEVQIEKSHIEFVYEIRASHNSSGEYIYEKINIISRLLGGSIRRFAQYPSWTYRPDSKLRSLVQESHKKLRGREMKNLVVHAGLECGCFSPKIDNLDAVAMGPNTWDLHSPYESLSVSSTERIFTLLCEVLKNMD